MITLSASPNPVYEDSGSVTIYVTLSHDWDLPVTFSYATSDITANYLDYGGVSGTMTIPPLTIGVNFAVPIFNHPEVGTKQFSVAIGSSTWFR